MLAAFFGIRKKYFRRHMMMWQIIFDFIKLTVVDCSTNSGCTIFFGFHSFSCHTVPQSSFTSLIRLLCSIPAIGRPFKHVSVDCSVYPAAYMVHSYDGQGSG